MPALRPLLALLFLALGTASAFAHASLIGSEPAEGAILDEAPRRLVLTFNEPVSPLVLRLVAPDGSVSEITGATVEGVEVGVPAPAAMPRGTWLLSYRVVSLDGHPVGGTLAFSLGEASAVTSGLDVSVDWPRRSAIWLVKVVLYGALFLGAGAAPYRAVIAPLPGRARRFAIVLAAAGVLAAGVSVGLQGLDALDAPFDGIFHKAIWQAVASTTYFTTATVAILALLAAIASLKVAASWIANVLAFAAVLLVGLALAASGHASSAAPQWLMRPAVFLHTVALAFWIGALPPLALTLRVGGEGAAQALARFSRLIPFAIAPLVLSGLALAAVQLGTPAGLTGTAYGRVLLVKLTFVTVLFALAAWNRWALTEKAEAADPAAVKTLVRSIMVETALVLAVLGVVALWRFTPPPRALIEATTSQVRVHLHGDKAMALLSLSPGRVGRVTASIAIMPQGAEPLTPSAVTLVVTKAGLEAISRPAHRMSDGTWQVDGLPIPLGGDWSARVEILVGDFEMIRLEGPFEIGP